MVQTERFTQALIVGAGPTGLLAAAQLRRRGIDCILIEKKQERSPFSKALALHARTMEMLDLMGIAETFAERGYPAAGAQLHLGGSTPAKVEFYRLHTRFPYVLVLPQSETEEILEDYFTEQGGCVERETELVRLSEDETGVTAVVSRNGGTERIHATYVLACDGAHSKTRQLLNVPFPGEAENFVFFLGDVQTEGLDHDGYMNVFFTEHGLAFFVPFKDGYVRVIAADFSKQDRPHIKELLLEELQDSINRIVPLRVHLKKQRWLSQFGTVHRQVESYREGRVFFVGDAAHIHNPIGGQGMNLGLQDAFNVTWKLALVLRNQAHPSILDTYHEERRPIGEQILETTSRLIETAMVNNPWLATFRNLLGRQVASSPFVQQKVTENMTNIAVHYQFTEQAKQHTDIELGRDALQAGDRVTDIDLFGEGQSLIRLYQLLQQNVFTCLIYLERPAENKVAAVNALTEKIKREYGGLIKSYVVLKGGTLNLFNEELPVMVDVKRQAERILGMEHRSILLIRPDGYVAFHQKTLDPDRVIEKIGYWLTVSSEGMYRGEYI